MVSVPPRPRHLQVLCTGAPAWAAACGAAETLEAKHQHLWPLVLEELGLLSKMCLHSHPTPRDPSMQEKPRAMSFSKNV